MIQREALNDVVAVIENMEEKVTNEAVFAAAFNRIVNLESRVKSLEASIDEMLGAQRNFAQGVEDERI